MNHREQFASGCRWSHGIKFQAFKFMMRDWLLECSRQASLTF
jgi:hypothetical protein